MHLFCSMPCRVVPPLVLRHEFHLQWGRQKDLNAQNGWLPAQAKPVAVILDPGRLHFGIPKNHLPMRSAMCSSADLSIHLLMRSPTVLSVLLPMHSPMCPSADLSVCLYMLSPITHLPASGSTCGCAHRCAHWPASALTHRL